MKKLLVPTDMPKRPVASREVAKALECSMSLVRWLAKTGKLRSWTLGPRSRVFDFDEVTAYKQSRKTVRDAARKAGRKALGSEPQGFSPDK